LEKEIVIGKGDLSLSRIHELVAARVPDRVAIAWRDQVLTHRELTDRSSSLAHLLIEHGLGRVVPRESLQPWECGQDFVGVLMSNRPEFIEALFGAFKARCVPFNINYRYGPAEVRELLVLTKPRAMIYESCFAGLVDAVRNDLDPDCLFVEVGSGDAVPVHGARNYERAIASGLGATPSTTPSPDDLHALLTGGTTGRPKAVLWRQGDLYFAALRAPTESPENSTSIEEMITSSCSARPRVVLAAPPFMHGAGQWSALTNVLSGDSVAIQSQADRLDVADIWRTVERHRVGMLLIAGNAYGVPLLEELQRQSYDLGSLRVLVSGAVGMTAVVKGGFMTAIPGLRVVEAIGASETGTQLRNEISARSETKPLFTPGSGTAVLDETRTARLKGGHPGSGWLARVGRVPLGYLADPHTSRETFPVIDGVRHAVAGDRARLLPNGTIEFLGRNSTTINTGGEKVFVEEVEAAISASPEVADVLVTSKPHERWGEEIVTFVLLHDGAALSSEELQARLASQIARYKIPKRVEFVEHIPRSVVGKPDYGWARSRAAKL
jgi:3-oxocholest-4-en-26-oate---CoA ligase